MKKKILSLLLAVVMLISILPMSAISAYAAVITEDTVVTDLNVGDIVVRGTTIKYATRIYQSGKKKVLVPYLYVNGAKYDLATGYYNNSDSCVKITSQTSTSPYEFKDIITVENACNTNELGTKISDATCSQPAQYELKCSYCHNVVTTGSVGSALGHSYTKQGSKVSDATCTSPAIYKAQCASCTETSGTMEVGEPLGHNIVGGVCKSCGELFVDFTAYDSALAEVVALDENAYTAESIAEYKEAVENAKVNKTTATITQTDIATAKILSAKTLLNKKECSVAVYMVDDNSSSLVDTATVNYGDVYNASVSLGDNQRVYKWTMTNNGKDSRLNTKDTFVSQVINGDTELYCFVDNEPVNHFETSRVVFYDRANRVISIHYVPVGATVGTSEVTAPQVPFYRFNEWEVVKGDPNNAPTSGVEFRATYVYNQAVNQVLIVGVGNVKVNGQQEYKAYYDEVLKLTGATSYAYGDNDGNVIEGISGDYIYAPNNQKTIYIVAGQSTKATTKLTGWVDDNNKITANAQYYLPSDCSLVEAGVKVAKTADAVTTGSRFKAELIGETGEYSITLGYGSSKGTLYFASYLIYKDSEGTQHTIYSDAEAISFGA